MIQLSRNQVVNLIIVASGLIALLVSFAFDNSLVDLVGKIRTPALDYLLGWAAYALSVVFVLLVMTSLFMWEEKKRDWILPLWGSFLAAVIISVGLKLLVSRERPLGLEMDLIAIKDFLTIKSYSFPSTHAAACFSVIPLLDKEYPMFKWFWIGFALLVAFSRLYLQVHYLSDIIAGMLIGYVIGITMIYLKDRYRFLGAA